MARIETVESLLSPSLRVSRPVAACSRCRGAKVRCDGKLPACTACEKVGKADSCSGANDEFAKGKERSYVAALEAACERLQERIAKVRASRNPDVLGDGLGSTISPRLRGSGSVQTQEASDMDDLVGDFGFLSVNATSRDFYGFTGTMSWARLLLTMASCKPLQIQHLPHLPPRHYAIQLVQRYLNTSYVFAPFISEASLMGSVHAVYGDSGRPANALDHWTLRMVLAISIASVARSRHDSSHQEALSFVSAALNVAEDVLHPGSVSGLQAILLLTQYSLIDAEHFRSWHLVGIASRVLVDLGLHQDPSPDAKTARDVLDLRRRVFHSLYCMDRHISIACKQAFSLTDDSTSVALPCGPSSAHGGDSPATGDIQQDIFLRSIQPFIYLCKIRQIQSSFYQELNESSRQEWSGPASSHEYVWSALENAEIWFRSLPTTMSQEHLLSLRLEWLYTRNLILSPSIRIPKIPDLHKALILDYSNEFAELLQQMLRDTRWNQCLTYADIQRMNILGTVVIDVLSSAYDQIISGQITYPPSSTPDPSAPKSPSFTPCTDVLSNVDKALQFFDRSLEVLDYARNRWDMSTLKDKHEQQAATLINKLRLKQTQLRKQQASTNARFPTAPAQKPQEPQIRPSLSNPQPPVPYQQSPQWTHLTHQTNDRVPGQIQPKTPHYPQSTQSQSLPPFSSPQSTQFYSHYNQNHPQQSMDFPRSQHRKPH